MNSFIAICFTLAVLIALYRVCCGEAHLYVRREDQRLLDAQRDIIAASIHIEEATPSGDDSWFPEELSYTEGGQVKIARKGSQVYDDILKTF